MPLKVLIIGAGVCGTALVVLLQKSDPRHDITVIERFPALRAGGQQIDLKNQVGLLNAIQDAYIAESGMEFVNGKGKALARFGINGGSNRIENTIAVSTDSEIMRGDLVQVLYDAGTRQREAIEAANARQQQQQQQQQQQRPGAAGGGQTGSLKYEFGQTATELAQRDGGGVDVTFADGRRARYDLVVAADGQGSRTRRMVFGAQASDAAQRRLGVHAAYYSIPRAEGDDDLARAYLAHGCRGVMKRTGDRDVTQVYMFTTKHGDELRRSYKEPILEQQALWAELFKDAGWECSRFADGLKSEASANNFYAHEILQVKMSQWSKGRVVLLGDAGYCPSLLTGMGTTVALVGTYILAGELARHGDDVVGALKSYEEVGRVPIDEYQKLPFQSVGKMFPESHLGVSILRSVVWAVNKIGGIISYLLPETMGVGGVNKGSEWVIPEYPELNLET